MRVAPSASRRRNKYSVSCCGVLVRARIQAIAWRLRSRGNARKAARVAGFAHCRSSRHTRTGVALARCFRCACIWLIHHPGAPDRSRSGSLAVSRANGSPSAARSAKNGSARPSWSAAPAAREKPCPAASSTASRSSRDLPVPGSPSTSTTPPTPCRAHRSRSRTIRRSGSRPHTASLPAYRTCGAVLPPAPGEESLITAVMPSPLSWAARRRRCAASGRCGRCRSWQCPFEEATDGACGGFEVAFEQEVAAVEQADLGAGGIDGKREGAFGHEDLVVAPPHGQQRDLAVAQVGVEFWVQRGVAGVVGEKPQLHQVVTGAGHQGEVVIPGIGGYQALIRHAVQVLPP